MTTFERFERDIPTLMDEIAPPRLPDYLDDMLRQTGRTRQRPAWASLERWLPMDVVARPTILRAPALRSLLILLLIGILVAAGLALYAGSQQARLPAPFGPARNGLILGSVDEDIVALDPATGTTSPLISGPTRDIAPLFARDGSKFMFVRLTGVDVGGYWLASADGTNPRELVPAPVDWFEFDDAGGRIVVTRIIEGATQTSVVDITTGTATMLSVGAQIEHPYWRPGHDQIVFKTSSDAQSTFYLANADGSESHQIRGVSQDAINDPAFSPDGSKFTYASWQNGGQDLAGRIHVFDIDTETDVLIPSDPFESNELNPRFSPDGRTLVYERYSADPAYGGGYRLVAAPADGSSAGVALGPVHVTGTEGAAIEFSPDGTQLLVTYYDDKSTWLLNVDGSGEQRLSWSGEGGTTWQRLAP